MTICVTNIQMDAAISSLRRPSLSTKAIAPKVAATFTAHHSCILFSFSHTCTLTHGIILYTPSSSTFSGTASLYLLFSAQMAQRCSACSKGLSEQPMRML